MAVLGLLMERSATWLECRDLDRDEPRTVRIDRIESARLAADEEPGARARAGPRRGSAT